MRRIVFSIAFFRKKLPVQSTSTSTKTRWKFYTQVGHRSFHTAWTLSGPSHRLVCPLCAPTAAVPGNSGRLIVNPIVKCVGPASPKQAATARSCFGGGCSPAKPVVCLYRTPYGRLTRSKRRSRMHPVLLQKFYEGAHLRQKQAVAQG